MLLTSPGANVELAGYIADNLEALVRYLASARVIHVTSFFDDRTPDRALDLLRRAKELNPAVAVHLDPGTHGRRRRRRRSRACCGSLTACS